MLDMTLAELIPTRLVCFALPLLKEGAGNAPRVREGPRKRGLTAKPVFAHPYEVAPASERMGLRLKGIPGITRALFRS